MPEEETSGAEPKQPKKRTAKKVAALRPRPDLLSNPALSGAASVAARSVLGQGAGVHADKTVQIPASAAQDAIAVPAPSTPLDSQGAAEAVTPAKDQALNEGAESGSVTPLSVSATDVQPSQPAGPDLGDPSVPDSAGPGATRGTPHAPQGLADDGEAAADQHHVAPASKQPGPGERGTTAETSEAEPNAGEAPASGSRRKRSVSTRQGPKVGPAHTALLNSWRSSRVDLKLRRDAWQTHPFRFAADLVTQLSKRVAQDCSSSGKSLTAAQYVDAAMSQYLPATIEEQLALAEEFLLSRETDVGTGKQASHRVSPEVYAVAAPLANDLREAGHARIAVHVYSGALDSFLRDLEAEGPLGK
ncbi:hypothetical protein APS67_005500 [Streptomyces sp. AVP053U2]|nr:hypothetical protein APS67_005500 [Streptomyces sp. AVP053U2]